MLYTLLACCFVSHLNYTPAADSCTEPAAVIFGLPHYVLVRQPLSIIDGIIDLLAIPLYLKCTQHAKIGDLRLICTPNTGCPVLGVHIILWIADFL